MLWVKDTNDSGTSKDVIWFVRVPVLQRNPRQLRCVASRI
jgi:hypothetical protein